MSHEVKRLFSSIAPTYDALNHILSLNMDKSWRRKTIKKISFSPDKTFQALDLCAGTLDLSIELLKQYPLAQVWAIDFSAPMLDEGKKKLTKDHRDKIHTVCGNALNLPFKANQFDVVFCGYGFRNLDNKQKGLLEMQRILKPGGQVLILDFFKPKKRLTKIFHKTYGQVILPTIGRLISKQKGAYRYLHDSIDHFLTLSECEKMFVNQGFNRVNGMDFLIGISSLITGFKI